MLRMHYSIGCLFLFVVQCQGISIVYNLRIAETTKRQAFESQIIKPFIAVATLFDTNRKTYDHIHQNFGGGFGSFIYLKQKFFARFDFAVANAISRTDNVHFSTTQADDLLFTAGYGFKISDKTMLSFSGLFGVPTHKDLGLQGVQVGTGHFGLGVQGDGSFTMPYNERHSIRPAARIVHFFSRTIGFENSLITGSFSFTPGNLIDLLVAYNIRFGRQRFETGYNATFLRNAKISPALDDIVARSNFIRSSFYAAYGALFLLGKHASAAGLAFSYGFDHSPQQFGIKHLCA
jgi:hypothetical protein